MKRIGCLVVSVALLQLACPGDEPDGDSDDNNINNSANNQRDDDACPGLTSPAEDFCDEGQRLEAVVDEGTGCVTGFICVEAEETPCPELTPPSDDFCDEGETTDAVVDEETGCVTGFICVEAEETPCPELTPPSDDFCDEGEDLESIVDPDTGCTIGFNCVPGEALCPDLPPLPDDFCDEDGEVVPIVDPDTDCVTGFECEPFTCPEISPPSDFCDEGEELESIVDPDTGCTIGFNCVTVAVEACARELGQDECVAAGGLYGRWGLLDMEFCLCPASDAGEPCTDSGQCEGFCVGDNDACSGDGLEGTCAPYVSTFGCFCTLIDGMGAVLCVD